MIVRYHYSESRGRFTIACQPELFDGDPGLAEIAFDGINENLAADTAGLASWMLLGRFVSSRLTLPQAISLPLSERIRKDWAGALALQPMDDKPARFPPRVGTLLIAAGDTADDAPSEAAAGDGPVYRFRILPAGGSGTLYEGGRVAAKTNVGLLGQGVNGPGVGGILAAAMLYADFLGVSDLILPASAIDRHPPAPVTTGLAAAQAWRELIKHAGFNLWVVK